jgi:hypothetical protein
MSSGICQDGKSPAFCAMQDRESAESFARSRHGRLYGGPDSKQTIHATHGGPKNKSRFTTGQQVTIHVFGPLLLFSERYDSNLA